MQIWICWGRWGTCIASAILSVCFYMLPLYVAPLVWKWFPDDNWLCNQPMIMKLHTLTPHEFVGVGGGPVLLQQYFQYAFICCPYMLPLLLTYGYHKQQLVKKWKQNYCDTLLRNMKSHIESMYCIETGRRWKMKTPEFYK